jgi:hypothetical protein
VYRIALSDIKMALEVSPRARHNFYKLIPEPYYTAQGKE